MELVINTMKCTGCRICEFACNYHHDGDFSSIGSSLMLGKEEKKNYFGMMLKRAKDLFLARPEGPETLLPGQQVAGGAASSKPILMRGPCDLCEDEPEPFCVQACPTGCLSIR